MSEQVVINPRKNPAQRRAKVTVEAILQATAHILVEEGYDALNTNHVADQAGVSVGSLYQYFPNKTALIAALWKAHFMELRTEMEDAIKRSHKLSLEQASREIVEASIRAHQIDPYLHRVLATGIPGFKLNEWDDKSDQSVHGLLRHFMLGRRNELRADLDIDLATAIVYRLVESTTHAAVIEKPKWLKEDALVDELVRMILAYVQ